MSRFKRTSENVTELPGYQVTLMPAIHTSPLIGTWAGIEKLWLGALT